MSKCGPGEKPGEKKDVAVVWSAYTPKAGQEPTYNGNSDPIYNSRFVPGIRSNAKFGAFGTRCTNPDQVMTTIKTKNPEDIVKKMKKECPIVDFSMFNQLTGKWTDYTTTPTLETPKNDKKPEVKKDPITDLIDNL